MNFSPSGTYACPICGKPRGGRVNVGKHEKCYKIMQEKMVEKNTKAEPKLRARSERNRKEYLDGKMPGVCE